MRRRTYERATLANVLFWLIVVIALYFAGRHG